MNRLAQLTACITMLMLASGAFAASDKKLTIESLPPSVVKTVPECGDSAVPASTKEISVTFSKDMMTDRMWSWCYETLDTFPEITNKNGIKYLQDDRTCVLPVKLKPNKTYAIWINTKKHNSFRDTSGNPAVQYLLVFKTK